MIKIKKFVFSPFNVNTFVVWDEINKEAAIIDPGCSNEKEEKELSDFISENELSVKYLLNTHCHIDHVLGDRFVKEKFNPIFIVPEKDLPLLYNLGNQGLMFEMKIKESPEPELTFEDAKEITLGGIQITPIFTPGHTPGEYCLYIKEFNILFSGDVLFKESIGRSDFWGGDQKVLIGSIKQKLFNLPDETVVYTGHTEETTIGYEKHHNPFIN